MLARHLVESCQKVPSQLGSTGQFSDRHAIRKDLFRRKASSCRTELARATFPVTTQSPLIGVSLFSVLREPCVLRHLLANKPMRSSRVILECESYVNLELIREAIGTGLFEAGGVQPRVCAARTAGLLLGCMIA
jgi:hypothetical protein